jgi:hypothetical protein
MKNLLLILSFLLVNSCSSPVAPVPDQPVTVSLNGTPLEMLAWAHCAGSELEIFAYDSTQNIRVIVDTCTVGMHPAFLQYQIGAIVHTADRAQVLITNTKGFISAGVSFHVNLPTVGISGTIKIDSLQVR